MKKLRLCQPFSSFTPTRLAGAGVEAGMAWPFVGARRAGSGTGGTTGARRRLRLPPAAAIFCRLFRNWLATAAS